MWILDHLPEVRSDFSVFHRIDDPFTLGSAEFFELAEWLPAYPGACQVMIRAKLQREEVSPGMNVSVVPGGQNRTLEALGVPTATRVDDPAQLAAITAGAHEAGFPSLEYKS